MYSDDQKRLAWVSRDVGDIVGMECCDEDRCEVASYHVWKVGRQGEKMVLRMMSRQLVVVSQAWLNEHGAVSKIRAKTWLRRANDVCDLESIEIAI
jgi:hypothetical protein